MLGYDISEHLNVDQLLNDLTPSTDEDSRRMSRVKRPEFATSRITTHNSKGFHFLAFTAQIIASTHLALIEMKGTPSSFLIFSFVAACLCQLTPPPTSPPLLRKNIAVGMHKTSTVSSPYPNTCSSG
jgi:hypothetical protein